MTCGAWCEALAAAGDWSAALAANEAAVECLADRPDACAEFLDGAALAVQQLRGEDLPERLDRAWRASPSLPGCSVGWDHRRRPSGCVNGVTGFGCLSRARFYDSVPCCTCSRTIPRPAPRCSPAPWSGWSNPEHPGPLLFPLFTAWLGDGESPDGMADADEISSPPPDTTRPDLSRRRCRNWSRYQA